MRLNKTWEWRLMFDSFRTRDTTVRHAMRKSCEQFGWQWIVMFDSTQQYDRLTDGSYAQKKGSIKLSHHKKEHMAKQQKPRFMTAKCKKAFPTTDESDVHPGVTCSVGRNRFSNWYRKLTLHFAETTMIKPRNRNNCLRDICFYAPYLRHCWQQITS